MLLTSTTTTVNSGNFPEWLPPLIIIPIMILVIIGIIKANKRKKCEKLNCNKVDF